MCVLESHPAEANCKPGKTGQCVCLRDPHRGGALAGDDFWRVTAQPGPALPAGNPRAAGAGPRDSDVGQCATGGGVTQFYPLFSSIASSFSIRVEEPFFRLKGNVLSAPGRLSQRTVRLLILGS